MKILSKSIFIAVLVCCSIFAAQAQRGGGWEFDAEKWAGRQTSLMVDSLSLSQAQAAKVQEINLKYSKKTQEARAADTDGDWSKMRESMDAIRLEQDSELQQVMTAEQFERWTKIREEMRNKRGGKGRPDKNSPKEKQG